MKTTARIKWLNTIVIGAVAVAMLIGFMWILASAVLQESFKNYPPTQAELAEDPSLAVYTEGQGK